MLRSISLLDPIHFSSCQVLSYALLRPCVFLIWIRENELNRGLLHDKGDYILIIDALMILRHQDIEHLHVHLYCEEALR